MTTTSYPETGETPLELVYPEYTDFQRRQALETEQKPQKTLRWQLAWSYIAVTVGTLSLILLIAAELQFRKIFLHYDRFDPDVWVQAVKDQAVPIARILLSESPQDPEQISSFVNYSEVVNLSGIDLLQMGNVTVYLRATAPLEMLILDGDARILGRTGFDAFPAGGISLDEGQHPYLDAAIAAALEGRSAPEDLVVLDSAGEGIAAAVPVYESADTKTRLLGVVAYRVGSMPTTRAIPVHTMRTVGMGLAIFLLAAGHAAA